MKEWAHVATWKHAVECVSFAKIQFHTTSEGTLSCKFAEFNPLWGFSLAYLHEYVLDGVIKPGGRSLTNARAKEKVFSAIVAYNNIDLIQFRHDKGQALLPSP